MTAAQMQDLARRPSNNAWTRHWLHWNYPREQPWLMALSVRDADGQDVELHAGGFALESEMRDGRRFYVVERTDESGEPFGSSLSRTSSEGG